MNGPAPAIALGDVFLSRRAAGPVLRGLSLDIAAGETLALVGRSGAGKSTLLKLINGLLRPDRGRVIVDGRDTREWNPYDLRRRIGYVLQEIGLFPHLDVARNVGLVPQVARLGCRAHLEADGRGADARGPAAARVRGTRGAGTLRRPASAGRRRPCPRGGSRHFS